MSTSSMTNTNTNGVWEQLLKRVNFNVTSGEDTDRLQSALSCMHSLSPSRSPSGLRGSSPFEMVPDDDQMDIPSKLDELKSTALLPLMMTSDHNKIDLGKLLIKHYHCSNLSLSEYLRRSSLFEEHLAQKHDAQRRNISDIIQNYLKAYSRFIEQAIPNTLHQFTDSFRPFDDDINIVLDYMLKLNRAVRQTHSFCARPTQLNVYFVAPTAASNELHSLSVNNMVTSSVSRRFRGLSGSEDVISLLLSDAAKRLFDAPNKRLILLVVRSNRYDTKNDSLLLFAQETTNDLLPYYKHNEVLFKIDAKKDIIPSKLNVDDAKYGTNYNLLNLSYTLTADEVKSFVYMNGYGQQISKRDIVHKWPMLFANHSNNINSHFYNEPQLDLLPLSAHNKDHEMFGAFVFGLSYQYHSYQRSKRQTLTFPKDILQNALPSTSEFAEQQQLYYYLTWTCKMQLIDAEFLHYTLSHRQPKEIAIFNTELHFKHDSNQELYIVALLNDKNDTAQSGYQRGGNQNKPKWKMANNGFMTKDQIKNIYGIDYEDLPKGSRNKHNYFNKQIMQNLRALSQNIAVPCDSRGRQTWHRVDKVVSQKYKKDLPRFNDRELNQALKHSVDRILDRRQNNKLDLIPILNIDTKNDNIRCVSLIPIRVRNKWMAVSFEPNRQCRVNQCVVTKLFVDVDDIMQKACLVTASAIHRYQWLKGSTLPTPCAQSTRSFCPPTPTPTPTLRLKPVTDETVSSVTSSQNTTANSLTTPPLSTTDNTPMLYLQQQLNDALKLLNATFAENNRLKQELDNKNAAIQHQQRAISVKDSLIKSLNEQISQMRPAQPPAPSTPNPMFCGLPGIRINTALPTLGNTLRLSDVPSGRSDASADSVNTTTFNGNLSPLLTTPIPPLPPMQITPVNLSPALNAMNAGFPNTQPLANSLNLPANPTPQQIIDSLPNTSSTPPNGLNYFPAPSSLPFVHNTSNSVMNMNLTQNFPLNPQGKVTESGLQFTSNYRV